MTIATTTNRATFTGTGAQTALSIPYKFYAKSDLIVTKRTTATGAETTLTLDSHYSVTGGNGATGTVTVIAGATNFPSTVTWTITRASPRTQALNLAQNDAFPAESLEAQLDKVVLQVQDLKEQVDRSLKYPPSDVSTLNSILENSVDRGVTSAILGWTSDGEPIITTASLSTALTTAYTLTLLDDVSAVTARGTLLLDGLTTKSSSASISVVQTDTAIRVSGSNRIDNITGGTAGQHLTIFWGAFSTFGIGHAKTSDGEIHLSAGQDLSGNIDNDILSLMSDGTDWIEVSRAGVIAPGITTLANDATPTVAGVSLAKTGGTTTPITDFDNGVVGQTFTLLFAHAVTISDSAIIPLAGSADFVGAAGDSMTFTMFNDQVWEEVSRKVN